MSGDFLINHYLIIDFRRSGKLLYTVFIAI